MPGRRARGPRTSRLVVDEVMQLPAGQIRESLQDGWRRSLRCEHAGQDLATRDQPRPVSLEGQEGLGELLGAQARELLRRAANTRARTWDWEAAAQVVEEQEDVQEQQEVPEPAGAPEELLEGSRRREGSVAGDTRGASLLRTSAQADESAAGLQAELSGVINEAGALGGEGGDQLAPPEVQGLDVTPVPEVPEIQQDVTREEPEVTVTEDSVLVRLWLWLVSC